LRTPIGIALALLFYVVLRGGLISPTLSSAPNSDSKSHAWTLLNPYGLAAIAAMAGMFSKQATDKLSEVFDTLFKTSQAVDRRDPLNPPAPVISGTDPAGLTVGSATEVVVLGQNFSKDCAALVNREARHVKWQSDMRLTVTLLPKDVSAAGDLLVIVQNPASGGGDSNEFRVTVRAAA
jgi:hypothetical protein